MSRKLPEELAAALARTGHHWPEADEDGLRRAAGLWREFGTEAERLAKRGGDSVQRVTGENSGQAVDAFADYWRNFAGGGRGHLDDAHGAAEALAGAFDKAAGAVDHCKAGMVAVLTELAEEIKKADAAEAKAKEQMSHAGDGLGGLVGAAVGAVKDVAAEVGEAIAVETAKHKIAGLLDELAREMKDAVQAAAKEPAVTGLERIAQADGRGLHGEGREASVAGRAGQVTTMAGAAAGAAVARSVEVAGVGEVHAALAKDGSVRTDRHGNPVLVGADGREIHGVQGVQVAAGQDGQPVVVDAEGKPVSGVALGENGKPVLGSDGKPLLIGTDGTLLGTGLALALGADGHPRTGADGHPMLVGLDGQPVSALAADKHGHLLAGADGQPVTVGQDGLATGPDGRTVAFDRHGHAVPVGGPGGTGVQVGLGDTTIGVNSGIVPGSDGDGYGHGHGHGKPGPGGDPYGTAQGPNGQDGGLSVRAAGMSASADLPPLTPSGDQDGGAGNGPVAAGGHGHGWGRGDGGGNSGGNGGYGGYQDGGRHQSAPVVMSADLGGSDDYVPPPVHHGPAAVHTDSVAVAPAPSVSTSDGDIWSGGGSGGGGGGHRPVDLPGGGGSSSGASGAGSFQLGPVGGGGASGGMPGAGPLGGGVLGGPVAGGGPAGALGGPIGGGVPGASAPVPGAGPIGGGGLGAGTGAGPVGAAGVPAAGASGTPGGSVGGSTGAVIGVGTHAQDGRPASGAGARGPVGGPQAPGGPGQQVPGGPVRFDPLFDTRRRDGSDGSELPVHPGQVASAWLVVHSYRSSVPPLAPPVEALAPRTIADSRPYGRPGGLGPVDPAHQAETVRRTPVPGADPRAGDWIESLNGGGPREPGRANNSVDVALSAVDTAGGYPTCAAPRLPDGPAGERGGRDRAERELGARFLDLGDGDAAFDRLERSLLHAGGGTRAVLLTLDAYGRSHTWNAVNHEGVLTWLDHLTGYRSDRPIHPADHGLWAIAVDADNRPLDLSDPPASVPVPAARPAAQAAAQAVPAKAPQPAEPDEPAAGSPVPAAAPAPVPAAEVPQDPTAAGELAEPAEPAEPTDPPSAPAPAAAVPPRSRLTVHRTTGSPRR
ncbi:toxin glutamine deamidase domain-containing protein [Kitasatospora paracochleata]|uniref:Papain fold toxin 1 (Glutamine deamidase) of polymorphic toxin system n=2 Tax=Kitasatospora paracochleata TaxID=58354 RepID=A0ABT1IXM9_9ACTN|nr:toxin glutamine deamidase domain-containing protein [Kitasatospora paracochleata]MCP2309631.1 hypothetical protein [Kitasatospora paracochleata]